MHPIENPKAFINTDLDIVSKVDLSPLATFFEDLAMVFNNHHHNGQNHLTLELNCREGSCERTAEETIQEFSDLLKTMPQNLRTIWDECDVRQLDMGFDSFVEPKFTHRSDLSPKVLRLAADLNATVRVTIYPIFETSDGENPETPQT